MISGMLLGQLLLTPVTMATTCLEEQTQDYVRQMVHGPDLVPFVTLSVSMIRGSKWTACLPGF